jgi:hypothetical protein
LTWRPKQRQHEEDLRKTGWMEQRRPWTKETWRKASRNQNASGSHCSMSMSTQYTFILLTATSTQEQ